jgi:hypothetical protein
LVRKLIHSYFPSNNTCLGDIHNNPKLYLIRQNNEYVGICIEKADASQKVVICRFRKKEFEDISIFDHDDIEYDANKKQLIYMYENRDESKYQYCIASA